MKALVIEGPYQAVVKEVPYPKPAAGELTIKVERAGICGTDVHIFKGEFMSSFPIIPGHEFSGVVHEIGENVEGWQVGDRVAVEPTQTCGKCRYCKTQRANQCTNWRAIGVNRNGAMAEFVSVPAQLALKMPDSMDFETGAFVEPMACVVHALNRLQAKAGDRILLFGAGAMGQQLIQSLVKVGASELVVVDISQEKLDMALKYGATKAIESKHLMEEIGPEVRPEGFDIVIDATGILSIIEQAFTFMGPTAKYLQFGVTAQNESIRLDPFELYNKDWTVMGSMAINYSFIPAFEWLKENRVNVKPLLSKVINLDEAVDFFTQPRDAALMKVQIKP